MSGSRDGGYPIGDPEVLAVALKFRDVMEPLGVDRRRSRFPAPRDAA